MRKSTIKATNQNGIYKKEKQRKKLLLNQDHNLSKTGLARNIVIFMLVPVRIIFAHDVANNFSLFPHIVNRLQKSRRVTNKQTNKQASKRTSKHPQISMSFLVVKCATNTQLVYILATVVVVVLVHIFAETGNRFLFPLQSIMARNCCQHMRKKLNVSRTHTNMHAWKQKRKRTEAHENVYFYTEI